MSGVKREVTVIYCCDDDLAMYRKKESFNLNAYGDIIIPHVFKRGKTIVAMCDGDVNVTNSVGEKLVDQYSY